MAIIRYTTPKCLAQYPALLIPDTHFNPEGDLKVTAKFEGMTPALQELINKLHKVLDPFVEQTVAEARPQDKAKIRVADFIEEDDEGNFYMKFKQRAIIKKKDGTIINVKLAHFDAKGKPLEDVNVGRDSTIKIAFTASPYYMPSTKMCGLSLRPCAIQVINLQTGGNDAASYGFEEEEGGYEATSEAAPFDALEEDHDF